MEKSLIAAGVFRPLLHRQQRVQLHSDEDGIFHLALRIARMQIAALNLHGSRSRIEVFIFQFSDSASVHSIGIIGPELFHVELHHSSSDFLVRCESYADFTVLKFRMFNDILHRIHYFRNPGLVVCPEQSRTVSGNESLPLVVLHFREILHLEV